MSAAESVYRSVVDRRSLLKLGIAAASGAAWGKLVPAAEAAPAERGKPTQFQIACMTLPYSQFPLQRALEGIKSAGYE